MNHFLIDFKACFTEGAPDWFCNPGQEPVPEETRWPRWDSTTIVLLSDQVVKLPSKCLLNLFTPIDECSTQSSPEKSLTAVDGH